MKCCVYYAILMPNFKGALTQVTWYHRLDYIIWGEPELVYAYCFEVCRMHVVHYSYGGLLHCQEVEKSIMAMKRKLEVFVTQPS